MSEEKPERQASCPASEKDDDANDSSDSITQRPLEKGAGRGNNSSIIPQKAGDEHPEEDESDTHVDNESDSDANNEKPGKNRSKPPVQERT